MTIKTRFAPSPTGYLHIGGVRTALYSWLHARKNNGKFVLRIEDTDRERSTQESVDAIIEGMQWIGLDYDEGPIFQTDRFDRYAEVINQLLEQGDAYHCTCTREELDAMRESQRANKEKPRYNGKCRDLTEASEGLESVIRFRNPTEGDVIIDDLIKGQIIINNRELDDLIIARSDGTPTYNLTVVVDDLDMGITHVIRGDDHINNTPRQINMMNALIEAESDIKDATIGTEIPKFAHSPMILGDDGKRLSKRHGAVSVMQYRDDGFFPQALLNYLLRLGWSHEDQEIFSREEMIDLFRVENVNGAASTFNSQKLIWVNEQYIKTLPATEIAEHLEWHLNDQNLDISGSVGDAVSDVNVPAITDVIEAHRDRAKTLKELAASIRYYYEDVSEYDEKAIKKHFKTATPDILQKLADNFKQLDEWTRENIQQAIKNTCEELGLGMGKVGPALRVAITGTAMSPSLEITLDLVGRERSLERLDKAIAFARAKYES
ncbi:MAG TPA: glutamate--tRNA ligase [Leucothrix mucor]|nr:glutamate--tRNA ligase [Leucothrix mucor]